MKKYIIEKVKKILEQETSYYNLKNITDINSKVKIYDLDENTNYKIVLS